jgi:hypothetical protein
MTLKSTEISDRGFWLTETDKGHCFDIQLAEQLNILFRGYTVLDLGCGHGQYSKGFIQNNIPTSCFDGNPNTPVITEGLCATADLTLPQNFTISDWVLCLEVGEHIPEQYEDMFIKNLVSHAKKGIVLSWGVPNQPGDGHVNCRSNEYVISLLQKHGYSFDAALSSKLRYTAELWWFKDTVMVFRRVEVPKITFCIPSKNNLRYLKTCIPSIRENAYRNDHNIIVFVDADTDGTMEWLDSVRDQYNITVHVNPNLHSSLFGIGKAYDYCITHAPTDVVMIFHADMMLGKHADYHAFKHLERGKVVCSTRIEPPIHPNGGEKILIDFGLWPEEFSKNEFNIYVDRLLTENSGKTTDGMFAPWMLYREDLLAIGGHDPILHSAREDSDIFNRFVLNGYTLLQSWDSLVYHLTGRGGQFQHGTVSADETQKSEEWKQLMMNSTKEFIRKWGTSVKHTPMLKPLVPHKYDIQFAVTNMVPQLIGVLEPMCSSLRTDLTTEQLQYYISVEQQHTSFNLNTRLFSSKEHDITVTFDARKLNNQNFQILQNLPEILDESELEVGTYELDIFSVQVKIVQHYESTLIHI